MQRAAIIGRGKIATHLIARLIEEGLFPKESIFSISPSGRALGASEPGFNNPRLNSHQVIKEVLQKQPVMVFLPISTLDKGEAAKEYTETFAGKGIRVVTSEKGLLAYYPDVAHRYRHLVGNSASLGGGTFILPYLHTRRVGEWPVLIHAVVNGTLNYILTEASLGKELGEICGQAEALGYAEPGANDLLSLVRGELKDIILLKTSVFYNELLARNGHWLLPTRIEFPQFGESQLAELNEKAGRCRFIVSFTNRPDYTPDFSRYLFGGFRAATDGPWQIWGGFRQTAGDPKFEHWLPNGVNNAVHVVEGAHGMNGSYTLSGPGAGLGATTTAMITDARRLLEQHNVDKPGLSDLAPEAVVG